MCAPQVRGRRSRARGTGFRGGIGAELRETCGNRESGPGRALGAKIPARAGTGKRGVFYQALVSAWKQNLQVVDLHSKLGSVPIEGIEIDPLSRDDVPVILRGLARS